tara:strand:- start:13 stop:213 length:201 start_codon:yes stop_codon:yes gene_type:complete
MLMFDSFAAISGTNTEFASGLIDRARTTPEISNNPYRFLDQISIAGRNTLLEVQIVLQTDSDIATK